MYEEFFGLSEKPFSIQPDPSFLYWGRSHRLAYAMLEYGVLNHAGISVVTGGVGCGKTTLIHRLLDQLSDTHTIALISNIQEGRGDLLSWVLMGYGQPFAGKSHVELFAQLQSFFIGEYAKGRRCVLIIDEAQNLSVDQLEELRMLSNINAGKDQLLQLILVGQPELKNVLNRPDMLQLAQRVGSDFHLTPLTREEVDAYIDTRLTIAGARRRIFTDKAVDLIAEASGGVPRVINILADTALVYAFSGQDLVIDDAMISTVIHDKKQFGVFGIASEGGAPQKETDSGPVAFVRGGDDLRAEPAQESGSKTAKEALAPAETPRMRPAASVRSASRGSRAAAEKISAEPDPSDNRVVELPKPANRVDVAARAETAPAAQAQPRSEARPASRPELVRAPEPEVEPEPQPQAAPPQAAPKPAALHAGVVIIGAAEARPIDFSVYDANESVVFVGAGGGDANTAAAKAAGLPVLEIADKGLSPGRARNAGYRALKKQSPGVKYVQFVESGFSLDRDWLGAAERFMDRRPEVAAVEGRIRYPGGKKAVYARVASNGDDPGEVRVTGPNVLVRADSFEAAGGFRGDLVANETTDLCIRLRRRAAHIWRLDAIMGESAAGPLGFGGFWRAMMRRGFEFAHGAALHGAPPDSLYANQRLKALLIGGAAPLLFLLAAFGGAIAALFIPLVNPIVVALSVLSVFAVIFGLMVVAGAIARGPGKGASWSASFLSLFGQAAAFLGVMGYYIGGAGARKKPRPGV